MSTNSTKTVKGRISNKHGTEADWLSAAQQSNFTPLPGELIVYDPDNSHDYFRFKFGDPEDREDGPRNVEKLPFVGLDASQLASLESVAYGELIEKRALGQLQPGKFYRIVDYHFTTVQSNTASADLQFDIIVLASTEYTLSEVAYATNHVADGVVFQDRFLEDDVWLQRDKIEIICHEWYDHSDEQNFGNYKDMDVFVGYGFLENNEGILVPVLYKTDISSEDEEILNNPDKNDAYFFIGRKYHEGQLCDCWRKIDLENEEYGWNGESKYFAYTNIITRGDIVFDDPFINCSLAQWELRYTVENDQLRFNWADPNGFGVIYQMKDEWGNDCPYDFKNALFGGYSIYNREKLDLPGEHYYPTFFCGDAIYRQWGSSYVAVRREDLDTRGEGTEFYAYSFPLVPSAWSQNYFYTTDEPLQANSLLYTKPSLDSQTSYGSDPFIILKTKDATVNTNAVCNNIIKFGRFKWGNIYNELHNIIFVGFHCQNNYFASCCGDMTLVGSASFNTFEGWNYSVYSEGSRNLFENTSSNISLGNYSDGNVFRTSSTSHQLGEYCSNNVFDTNSQNIWLGDQCSNNYFGVSCQNIQLLVEDGTTALNYVDSLCFEHGCANLRIINNNETADWDNKIENLKFEANIKNQTINVVRSSGPIIYEAPNTTHIILD